MDISNAYRHCALAWGADALPPLANISIKFQCADSAAATMDIRGYVLSFNKVWFHALWMTLKHYLSEDAANVVFSAMVHKIIVHELAHACQSWRDIDKSRENGRWMWHGAHFHRLMELAGCPVKNRFACDKLIPGTSIPTSEIEKHM